MEQKLTDLIIHLFDLRRGEVRRAVIMQVSVFLIISTLLIVKPAVNGLFLAKFGVEQLPYAFILVAVSAAIVSNVYSRLLFRVNLYHIYRYTLLSSIAVLVVFGILLRMNILEHLVLYAFYVWVAIFALLTTSQFWILANMVFDSREAKRIFSFIGAGAIAGGIFGGYLTSLLSQSFSSEFLAWVAALILAPTLFLGKKIWEGYLKKDERLLTVTKQVKYDSRHPFKIIMESRHLKLIAAIVGISVMAAKLVDYQFGGLASDIIQDPDELTAFFGFWFSTFNVVSLFIQLFVTRRIVGHFGVASTIFILPLIILAAAGIIFLFPGLLFGVVLLKMSDGGLKQSVNKAAMELLIFPISTALKNRTKTFIDVFVDSLATGFIGLVLIFIVKGMGMSYTAVNLLLVALIFIWLYLAFKVRKEYVVTISSNLRALNKSKEKKDFDLSRSSVLEGIRRVLTGGTEEQKIFMLKKIRPLADDRLIIDIHRLLEEDNVGIRKEALLNAMWYNDPHIKKKVRALIEDPIHDIRAYAIEYLYRYETETPESIAYFLDDPNVKIRSAALLGLARQVNHNRDSRHSYALRKRIQKNFRDLDNRSVDEEWTSTTVATLRAIGYGGLVEFYGFIDEHLGNAIPEIQEAAILAAGQTRNELLFDSLWEIASTDPLKQAQALIEAFSLYDNYFLTLLSDNGYPKSSIRQALQLVPQILRRIPRQPSVDYLFELLSHKDSRIRREALRALNFLKNHHEHLWFDGSKIAYQLQKSVKAYMDMLRILYSQTNADDGNNPQLKNAREALIKLLEKRMDQHIEIIFRILGLRYPPDDIISVYNGFKTHHSEYRNNAVEMLENILGKDMRKIILPIIESSMMDELSDEALKRLNLSIPDEKDSLIYLLENGDERLALATIYLLKMGDFSFKSSVADIIRGHYSKKVQSHAAEMIRE